MNNRIQQYKKMCWNEQSNCLDTDKFAELIIKECAELVSGYVNERTYYYAGNTILEFFDVE